MQKVPVQLGQSWMTSSSRLYHIDLRWGQWHFPDTAKALQPETLPWDFWFLNNERLNSLVGLLSTHTNCLLPIFSVPLLTLERNVGMKEWTDIKEAWVQNFSLPCSRYNSNLNHQRRQNQNKRKNWNWIFCFLLRKSNQWNVGLLLHKLPNGFIRQQTSLLDEEPTVKCPKVWLCFCLYASLC